MTRRLLVALVLVLTPMAVAAPAGAGGGGCHGPKTEDKGTVVELSLNCMKPTVLHVAPGHDVTWTNVDGWDHAVYGGDWGSDEMHEGDTFTHVFDDAGTYPYSCPLHPGMVGAVVVGDPPPAQAATVDESSSSALPTVPLAVGAGVIGLLAGRQARRRPKATSTTSGPSPQRP